MFYVQAGTPAARSTAPVNPPPPKKESRPPNDTTKDKNKEKEEAKAEDGGTAGAEGGAGGAEGGAAAGGEGAAGTEGAGSSGGSGSGAGGGAGAEGGDTGGTAEAKGDGKKGEGKKGEGKKDEAKSEEGGQDEGKVEGGEESKPDEGKKDETSADSAGELNPYVMKVIDLLGNGGGYSWPDGEPGAGGVTQNLKYEGNLLLKASSTGKTFCCGITFEILFRAWGLYANETGKPFFNGLPWSEIKKMKSEWFICTSSRKGPVEALVKRGLGKEVKPSEAKPGDFCQYWYGDAGHSVVFLSWDGKSLEFYSTQKSTSGRGKMKSKPPEMYIARCIPP